MPNTKPRGKGFLESPAIERLHVPNAVYDPKTPADRIFYDQKSIDGWSAVLIAINPAYMNAKRRGRILSDFDRLLTILIQEHELLVVRRDRNDAVVRKWYDMKAKGQKPSAALIARSLGMKHNDVRKIVTRIRAHGKTR